MGLKNVNYFIKAQKGSALVITMIISVVIAVGVGFLQTKVLSQKKSAMSNASNIENEIVLNSILDFVKIGIRQKWCFTNLLLNDSPSVCDLKHPRNVERLILTPAAITAINDLKAQGVSIPTENPITLTKIKFTVPLSNLTQEHPLYKIVNNYMDRSGVNVDITITNQQNEDLYSRGSESILKVTVSLKSSSLLASDMGSLTSVLTVFPHEVNNYALIIADDLYIGKAAAGITSVAAGDALMPNVGSISAKGNGLIFESPVYVNGNIYLDSITETKYTPVTFASDVVVGSGKLKRDDQHPFAPETLGGQGSKYYAEMNSFGGFKKGITFLGERDIGLDYLSGKLTGEDPNSLGSYMQLCIKRSQALSDLTKTMESDITARWLANDDNIGQHSLLLGLTQFNRFYEQNVTEGVVNKSGSFYNPPAYSQVDSAARGVAKVTVTFDDGKTIDVVLSRNSKVIIQPKFLDKAQFQTQINQQNAKINNLNNDVADINNQIDDLNALITTEKAKATPDAAKIANWQNQINNLKDDRSAKQTQIIQEQAILQQAQDNFDAAVLAEQNPPELQIQLRDIVKAGYPEFNQTELKFNFLNQPNFLQKFNVEVDAYDVGTKNGVDKRKYSNPDPTGDVDFGTRNGKLYFNLQGGKVVPGTFNTAWKNMRPDKLNNGVANPIDESINYGELDEKCKDPNNGSAFASASWDYSFAPHTRSSWNFAEPTDATWHIHAETAPNPPPFMVRSIVGTCIVHSDATIVAGLINCDNLIIESRTAPLKMIGTFIASKFYVDPAALKAGIWWSNIYHPVAVKYLRDQMLLRKHDNTPCTSLQSPIWHPFPNMYEFADHYKCNAISLRAHADPFTWTSVDPDCGLVDSNSSRTTCKNRPRRFFLKELGRGSL